MDDNSRKVRRCGQIGEGADDEVSIADVLEEQERLQADASAVLGASDPNNCTYPKGYLKRQALYACATCTQNGNAGICLACSYACHEGHDLYELYTKRFFRCDCGNDKFPENECKLVKEKDLNSRNRYNQNFKGLYCSCSRPYPDPEDEIEDEMIQCNLCEDWFHGRHLKATVPEDFFEMTCPECMAKFPFLWAYLVYSNCSALNKEDHDGASNSVDVEKFDSVSDDHPVPVNGENGSGKDVLSSKITDPVSDPPSSSSSFDKNKGTLYNSPIRSENQTVDNKSTMPNGSIGIKRQRDEADKIESPKSKAAKTDIPEPEVDSDLKGNISENDICLLQSLQKREYDDRECAVFWPQDWRLKLCKCEDCLEMYEDKGITFLLEDSDTVHTYEEAGTENTSQVSEQEEENIFEGMHRVQQIEIARGVRDLKVELNEFFQGFVREGKVVTETDVREFFQSLEEKRRERMNLPQNNCR